jgi:hypothetical protein
VGVAEASDEPPAVAVSTGVSDGDAEGASEDPGTMTMMV